MTISGWLFDVYPLKDKMIFWVKTTNGKAIRLEDNWSHSIYVAADNKQNLDSLAQNPGVHYYVKNAKFVSRYEKITDSEKSQVSKLTLLDSSKAVKLARLIESIDYRKYRLYNVDVLPAQSYFYEHDIFTLAHCKVSTGNGRISWQLDDDVYNTDYEMPDFKTIEIEVKVNKQGKLPQFTDKIGSFVIRLDKQVIELEGKSEIELLVNIENEIAKIDPDFIFTKDGDAFLCPYLVARAEHNETSIMLSREKIPLAKPNKPGMSFFSYGRIHFKPTAMKLYGRVHIDAYNSFILDHSALPGLYEIARVCRMPLHTAARASIGKCMSSLQFHHATKSDLLIPYKPRLAEAFKTYGELLIADRGGMIFEPEIGVHEKVAEFDFASLYPNIMRHKNISAETVSCDCCPDSKNRVPELDYNICEKRKGIVPRTLKILLDKRAKYKILKATATDAKKREIYDARQTALKWVLVTSFGYLGFNNAKFGRIDAHIAVCAFDRKILIQATRTAESLGFRVLHGIVDSLWVQKRNATPDDYAKLKKAIEQETGFEISFEGVYKWVAFVHAKDYKKVPVPNRYFGVFEDGKIKDRGIETRRHDTPALFSQFQREILEIMAQGNTVNEVKALIPKVKDLFVQYREKLEQSKVPLSELVFTKMLSKDSDAYSVNTVETGALSQLVDEGASMKAGEIMQYAIIDYYRKNAKKRSVPVELINEKTTYDANRYIELLAQTANSVTEPFGFSLDAKDNAVGGIRQSRL